MTADDLSFVTEQHLEHFPDGSCARLRKRFMTEYYASYITSPYGKAWVAVRGGRPIGFLVGTIDPVLHPRLAVLSHVVMVEAAQRARGGAALLSRFTQEASRAGCDGILLVTRTDGGAGDFYSCRGWREVDCHTTFDGLRGPADRPLPDARHPSRALAAPTRARRCFAPPSPRRLARTRTGRRSRRQSLSAGPLSLTTYTLDLFEQKRR